MIKKTKLITFICFLITFIPFETFSQGNYLIYDMSEIPQTSDLNPAFTPHSKFFIGIPAISNIDIGYYNTCFTIDDILIQYQNNDSLYLDFSKPASSKNKIDYFSQSAAVDIISLGFNAGNAFVTLGINTNLNIRFFYTSDLVKLLWYGNGNYINENMNMDKSSVFETNYNKYYAGLSFPTGRHVTLGIRASFIQGLSSITTSNNNLTLSTNVNDQTGVYLTGKTNFDVNTSVITYLFGDSATITPDEYFFNFKSKGFSLDIGVDVIINDNFSFQLSATNLGFITWRTYGKTYSSYNKDIYFDGAVYDFTDEDNENEALDSYLDALDSIFKIKESIKVFSSNLKTNIFANGQYTLLNEKHRFNLLFSGRFLEEAFEYAISVGYTYNPKGKFSTKISYTYLKYAPLNLGAGFFFKFKPFQLYMATDNILGMINWNDTQFIDFRFGLNIFIPSKIIKHEIPVQQINY
jgi:hypothetical protein